MKGQWIGSYAGSSEGGIVANIDELPSHYAGVVYLTDTSPQMPESAAYFKTVDKDRNFSFKTTSILPIHPRHGTADSSWDNVKEFYPDNVTMSTTGDVVGSWDENSLRFSWKTDVGAEGKCLLKRSDPDSPSKLQSTRLGWEEYRKHVQGLEGKKLIFRGQGQPWRLRTSFHRRGRTELTRFLGEDISELHRYLSARTKHVFRLDDPMEKGAFFNLIQHHGYPTPLLDWTYSPYVAAYFAYRDVTESPAPPYETIRIFLFDQHAWQRDFRKVDNILNARLHLSVSELLAIENERMIPQQAVSTLTNVDDIEAFVSFHEERRSQKYLSAIDLPISERRHAMEDLRYMGITAGSLFPGIDGTCQELRDRNFDF